MPVLLTTIGVPQTRDDAIPRERLVAVLREGLTHRVILLTAEAGYGKTTLLVQLARSLDWPVAWYTITEDGHDPATFLASLIAAVESARPGTAFTANQVMGGLADPGASWRTVATALINDLVQAAPGTMLIVLDDLHVVDGSPSAEIVGYLAAHLPRSTRLVLAGRTRPAAPEIARLAGQGDVLTLHGPSLVFSPAEVSQFLTHPTTTPLSEADIALTIERTEGWPLALQLIRQALNADGHSGTIRAVESLRGDRQEVYGFFGTQVLDRLPEELRRFLLRISILDPVDADVAGAIGNAPEAESMLRDLEARGLFLTALDTGARRYRLHPLFRETLRARLERESGPDEIQRLHREAGRLLVRAGRALQGIPHLLSGVDHEAVADALAAEGERWLEDGKAKTVAVWIAALPRHTVDASPHLLALLGWLANQRGEWDETVRRYASAALLATGDLAGAATAGQIRALIRLARFAEARALGERALSLQDLTMATRARLLHWVAKSDLESGMPSRAIEPLEQALALFGEAGDHYRQVLVLHDLTFAGGQLEPTPHWPERFLPLALTLDREAEHLAMRAEAAAVVGELLSAQARHEQALAYFEKAGEAARLLDDVHRVGLNFFGKGLCLRAMGRLQEARETLEHGLRFAEEHHAAQYVEMLRYPLALVTWSEGRVDEATGVLRRAADSSRRRGLRIFEPGFHVNLALVLAAGQDIDAARGHLNEAIARYRDWGAERRAAECALYLAALDVREQRDGEVVPGLADALAGARHHVWDRRFAQYTELLVPVLVAALIRGIETDYAAGLLGARGDADALAPVLAHTDSAARVRAVQVLERMGGERSRTLLNRLSRDAETAVRSRARAALVALSERPPAPLFIRLLGGFEIRKGSAVLPRDAWPRRRSRLLFAFLLIARRPVAREVVLETLWPDREPSAATASLNVAWSHVKRALEPGLPERLPSAYLLMEGGRYGVRPATIATDVEEFEKKLAEADRAADSDARVRSLEEAVSWYRDDLLPDDANEPWIVVERERLRLSHLSALERLADGRSEQGRFAEATEILRTLLRAEPWREAAYRQMMKALTAMGRRAEALHLYRQCEALLQRELDVRPSPETIALFETIAAGPPV